MFALDAMAAAETAPQPHIVDPNTASYASSRGRRGYESASD